MGIESENLMRKLLLELLDLDASKLIPDAELPGILATACAILYYVPSVSKCESMKEIMQVFNVGEHTARLIYTHMH